MDNIKNYLVKIVFNERHIAENKETATYGNKAGENLFIENPNKKKKILTLLFFYSKS
jgi:hypothetical protein